MDESELTKEIFSLIARGKKKEIKTLYNNSIINLQHKKIMKRFALVDCKEVRRVYENNPELSPFMDKIMEFFDDPGWLTIDFRDIEYILKDSKEYLWIKGTQIPEGIKNNFKGAIIIIETEDLNINRTLDMFKKITEDLGDNVKAIWGSRSDYVNKIEVNILLVR